MHIDWWTLGLQTVNVLVLIWLLGRFLFRPVAAMVAARQAEAVRLLDEAQAARTAARAAQAAAEAETARLAASRSEALRAAASAGEAEKAALLAGARREAEQQRAAALADAARQRRSDAAATAEEAGRLALDIAARLLTRLPPETLVEPFVEGLASGLAGLPEATRAGLGTDGALTLKAPRPLSPAEEEGCRARIAAVLGQPVDLVFATDPGLVAGLELETPHAVVRNSFRADLDRIAAALARTAAETSAAPAVAGGRGGDAP